MKSFSFVEFDSYWGFILLFAPMVVLELHDATSYLGCVSLCDKFITLLGSVCLGSFFDLCSFSFQDEVCLPLCPKRKKEERISILVEGCLPKKFLLNPYLMRENNNDSFVA